MKKAFNVIVGCLLIALSYNLFFMPYNIISTGVFGIGALLNYKINYDPALFILIVNFTFLIISYFALGQHKIKEYLIPSFLIPLFISFSYNIGKYIVLEPLETILVVIVGAFLTGLGYSLLYKEGQNVGGIDIMQDIINSTKVYRNKFFLYLVEGIILFATLIIINLETALYSLITIGIIRYLATKSKIGISTSKTFFIITNEEQAVKNYIIKELKHDLTEFNVKGGFSNTKSKILMTAMDTKDYYRLKEGINTIDPGAFISIVDSYEVINKNIALSKKVSEKGKTK